MNASTATTKKFFCAYCGIFSDSQVLSNEHFNEAHAEEMAAFRARRMERFGHH